MFERLLAAGFQVEYTSHAASIIAGDFSEAERELEDALLSISIPVVELIESGGGETRATQRLRAALDGCGWSKKKVEIRKTVDGMEKESTSHIIDHVRAYEKGAIALEIEWNNKDPFFDRDLENFKRLHAEGVFSVGVIVTRGESFQSSIKAIAERFALAKGADDFSAFEGLNYRPTPRFCEDVVRRQAGGKSFAEAWSALFCSDKYGEATTHWRKLMDRVRRGVGNPCPLVLLGIPAGVVDEA